MFYFLFASETYVRTRNQMSPREEEKEEGLVFDAWHSHID